jgi:DNA-binding transcriptional ArsR family regulator
VLRLRFTAEDLLRVTVAAAPAPLIDLTLAVATLRRDDPLFTGWRRRTLPREAGPLLALVPATAQGPLFLDPLTEDFHHGLDQLQSTPNTSIRAELQRVHTADRPSPWVRLLADGDRDATRDLVRAVRTSHEHLVKPSWEQISSAFHTEQAWRGQLLATQGIRATLEGLVPSARWQDTTLEIDRPGDDVEVRLDGRGLTLLPSVFWTGPPLAARYPDGNVLVYPALTPLPLMEIANTSAPLADLLGRGRAAILEHLIQPRTTTNLARDLGMAKSTISGHAKILRSSHLITTRRDGKAVWHTCTQLGLKLLRRCNGYE